MIRTIRVYVAADGQRFDDENKALEHVADVCREALSKRLKPLQDGGHMTASDVFRVVMALIPDAVTAQQLAEELSRMTLSDEG